MNQNITLPGVGLPGAGTAHNTVEPVGMEEGTVLPEGAELVLPVGSEQVRKAAETMRKYRDGKKVLENRIVKEEEFWRRRQWKYIDGAVDQTDFSTPWLFNCILSKYADVMDSYPTANLLARQRDDVDEAKRLSSIIPVIHDQNDFEATYSDATWDTLKHGGCAFGVFWDGKKHNGIGDIAVRLVDLLNLFWEPGISQLQKSANVFHAELVDIERIKAEFPQAEKINSKSSYELTQYIFDDKVDTSEKALVVDWYYRKPDAEGVMRLHLCKFVEDVVLFASENEPDQYPRGWYEHGEYPFVVQALYPIKGSIIGEGLISIGGDTQVQIDLLNRSAIRNAMWGGQPRYLARKDSGINIEDFANLEKPIVETASDLGDNEVRLIETKALAGNYLEFTNQKIEELKYCTSNQDANNGVAPSGITAASAIAALQETAGKNSRSINKTFHRTFREVIYQEIELIRQFYAAPREFRIIPDVAGAAQDQFVTYSNARIKAQPQVIDGKNMGLRVPEFDIEVTVEKASPYKKMEINELALGFFQRGFFNPQMCDQALACLRMMDFDGKDELMRDIGQGATMEKRLQMIGQLAFNLARKYEPAMATQIAELIGMQAGAPAPTGGGNAELGGVRKEPAQVEKARENARESTEVR